MTSLGARGKIEDQTGQCAVSEPGPDQVGKNRAREQDQSGGLN